MRGSTGDSWQRPGLERASDVQTVASGHAGYTVYVVNHALNFWVKLPGIDYTRNDGLRWTRAAGKELAMPLIGYQSPAQFLASLAWTCTFSAQPRAQLHG